MCIWCWVLGAGCLRGVLCVFGGMSLSADRNEFKNGARHASRGTIHLTMSIARSALNPPLSVSWAYPLWDNSTNIINDYTSISMFLTPRPVLFPATLGALCIHRSRRDMLCILVKQNVDISYCWLVDDAGYQTPMLVRMKPLLRRCHFRVSLDGRARRNAVHVWKDALGACSVD